MKNRVLYIKVLNFNHLLHYLNSAVFPLSTEPEDIKISPGLALLVQRRLDPAEESTLTTPDWLTSLGNQSWMKNRVYKSFKFQPFAALLELCSFSPQCVFCAPSKRKRQRKLCYTPGNQKVFSPVCVLCSFKTKEAKKVVLHTRQSKGFLPSVCLCSFKTKKAKKVVLHTRQSKGFLPSVCFMLLQNEKSKESCVTHSAIKSLSPQCVFCAHSKRKKAAFSSFASLILPKRKVNFARPKTRFYFR